MIKSFVHKNQSTSIIERRITTLKVTISDKSAFIANNPLKPYQAAHFPLMLLKSDIKMHCTLLVKPKQKQSKPFSLHSRRYPTLRDKV